MPICTFTFARQNFSRQSDPFVPPSFRQTDVYKISALTPSKLSTLIPDDAASSKAIAVITFVLIRFLLPFCSSLEREREEVPVSGTCSIIDVGGVGLSRFWGLRSHLQVRFHVHFWFPTRCFFKKKNSGRSS